VTSAKGRWVFGAALVLLMVFTLFPFYWAIVASLTPDAALFSDPSLWPQHIISDHYRALFVDRDFITPIRNSLVVAGTTTIFCLCVGTIAA
jgi:ABC-type glycerol-3-phosphate transport system permease component